MRYLMIWLVLACATLAATSVFAARGALVDVEGVDLRRGPGVKFGIIQKLHKGDAVVASNYPTEGFYKIRTLQGEVGWLPADSLVLQALPGEVPLRTPTPKKK